jgi:hypothetical protein
MTPTTIICDRCNSTIDGFRNNAIKSIMVTSGYYIVNEGYWKNYGHENEKYVCDACMFVDPRYIKTYGKLEVKKS